MDEVMEKALIAFLSSDLEGALYLCEQAQESITVDAEFIGLYSLLSYLGSKSMRAINLAGAYRETFRVRGEENIFASFLVALGNNFYKQFFKGKTGNDLPLYDLEVVYTTEDEVLVPRGRDVSEFDYSESSGMDFFWKCVIDGTDSSIQDFMLKHPEVTEEEMNHNIEHKRNVMNDNIGIVSRIGKEESVLDLGSGQGQLGCMLYAEGKLDNVVMVDVVPDYIKYSRKYSDCYLKQHNYTFVVGDILDSEWLMKLGTFDVIVACDLVEHLYNDELDGLLKTVMAMLNVNGRFYIQTPNGIRYLGKVMNDEGEIVVKEFLGKFYPHVSERSIGYYRRKIREYGYKCKILERQRIVLEIFN